MPTILWFVQGGLHILCLSTSIYECVVCTMHSGGGRDGYTFHFLPTSAFRECSCGFYGIIIWGLLLSVS